MVDVNSHTLDRLHELLTDGTRFYPRYLPSLNSDHLPMTLCAIAGLGGDIDTCVTYRNDYKSVLHEVPKELPIVDWRQGIGRSDMYPSLLAWFRGQVAEKGIESVVTAYLPEFISSLALEAFHPIIRLGYAIDFQSESETAAALAYLVSSHHDVPIDNRRTIDLGDRIQSQATIGPRIYEATGFTQRILELVNGDEYPVGSATDLHACADTAFDLYRTTRNFFALHMVTATHAVRICSKLIDTKLAVAALTGGLLAAHRIVGCPRIDRFNPLPISDQLDREHAYKYTWTCLSEFRHYQDNKYADEIRQIRQVDFSYHNPAILAQIPDAVNPSVL